VVAILFAASCVAAGRLQVCTRICRDPHARPRRRNHKVPDSFARRAIDTRAAGRCERETTARAPATNPSRPIGSVAKPGFANVGYRWQRRGRRPLHPPDPSNGRAACPRGPDLADWPGKGERPAIVRQRRPASRQDCDDEFRQPTPACRWTNLVRPQRRRRAEIARCLRGDFEKYMRVASIRPDEVSPPSNRA